MFQTFPAFFPPHNSIHFTARPAVPPPPPQLLNQQQRQKRNQKRQLHLPPVCSPIPILHSAGSGPSASSSWTSKSSAMTPTSGFRWCRRSTVAVGKRGFFNLLK